MALQGESVLRKMFVTLGEPVDYHLSGTETELHVNALLGRHVELCFEGHIECLHCGRKIRKSYNQGFCYPCFKRLPQCDSCIVKPELCHYHDGTCRDSSWGERNCFVPHVVYLANSSGLKVGITRRQQIPTRWIDQGAIQALPILEVDTRLQSGLLERVFAAHVADKTNWRAMLKGQVEPLNLPFERDRLLDLCSDDITRIRRDCGVESIRELRQPVVDITYPVAQYPTKVQSFNFDKQPTVSGHLVGIKGQYLIFDTGVINLRKFGGYHISVWAD